MRAELTVEIGRPPEEVWAYLTDVSNLPAWQSGVHSAEIAGGGEPATGARIEESRHLLGRELHTTLEVAECEPPRVFALRALDSPVPFTVRHELEPAGARARRGCASSARATRASCPVSRPGSWRGAPRSSSGRTSSA